MNDEFEIKWEVEDGYVGGDRPQYVTIEASDFEDMSEDEIREEINNLVEEEFNQRITWYVDNIEDAVKWAKKVNGK